MNESALSHQVRRVRCCVSRVWMVSFLAVLGFGLAAHAALILDLPDLSLQRNQAGQSFTISVKNTGGRLDFSGVQLELIVGDGDVAVGGSGGAPAFQGVTLLTPGHLFAANNTGDAGAGNYAGDFPPSGLLQLFQRKTSTDSGYVTLAAGTVESPTVSALATVTFDTTGIDPGTYSWAATWTIPSVGTATSFFTDSTGQVFPDELSAGTLTVVPEPVNVALGILGCVLAGAQSLRSPRLRRWLAREGLFRQDTV